MVDDLFPEILEVIIELLQGIVGFLLLALEHHVSFLFELAFASVELFLALSARFLVLLVLLVPSVEVEIGVVEDLGVVLVLVLHALL